MNEQDRSESSQVACFKHVHSGAPKRLKVELELRPKLKLKLNFRDKTRAQIQTLERE